MGQHKNSAEQLMDLCRANGDVLLTACFRDQKTAMEVLYSLPYVAKDGQVRPGTVAGAISKAKLKDGTRGVVVITGGDLTPQETRTAMALLAEHGMDQIFVGPGIGNTVGKRQERAYKKSWWKFW